MNGYQIGIMAMDWCFETSPWPIRSVMRLIGTAVVYAAIATVLGILLIAIGIAVPVLATAICAFLLFWFGNQLCPTRTFRGKIISISPRNPGNNRPCTITILLEDGRRIQWSDCISRPTFRSSVTVKQKGWHCMLLGENFEEARWGKFAC